jgi:hypothetical protein
VGNPFSRERRDWIRENLSSLDLDSELLLFQRGDISGLRLALELAEHFKARENMSKS